MGEHEPVLTVDGRPVATVETARSFAERSRGLLGRDGLTGALWLEPAQSVHTFGMRFVIDVAFVDRSGTVLRAVTMRPNRLSLVHVRARAVVEAEAGSFETWGLRRGARVAPSATGSGDASRSTGP